MKKLITISFLLIISLISYSQTYHSNTFGPFQTELSCSINKIKKVSDGFLMLGNAEDTITYVYKINFNNEILWKDSIICGLYGGVYDFKEDESGNYIVVGDSLVDNNNCKFWIFKLDKDSGNIIWSKTYGGSENDEARRILKTDDGNFFVIGRSSSVDGDVNIELSAGYNAWVIKINSDGDTLFTRPASSFSQSYSSSELLINDAIITNDNYLLLAGSFYDASEENKKLYFLKLTNDSVLDVVWEKIDYPNIQQPQTINDAQVSSLMQDPDGNIYFAGYWSKNSGNKTAIEDVDVTEGTDLVVGQINSDSTITAYNFSGNSNDEGVDIEYNEGELYVLVNSRSGNSYFDSNYGSQDIWLFKIDTNNLDVITGKYHFGGSNYDNSSNLFFDYDEYGNKNIYIGASSKSMDYDFSVVQAFQNGFLYIRVEPLNDCLLSRYYFNENLSDFTSNHLNMVLNGYINEPTNFVEDRFGNSNSAMPFNDTTFLISETRNNLHLDGDITVTMWINIDSLRQAQDTSLLTFVFDNDTANDNDRGLFAMAITNNKLLLVHDYDDGNSYSTEFLPMTTNSSFSFLTHRDYFVAVSRDTASKYYFIYIDGDLIDSLQYANSVITPLNENQHILLGGGISDSSGSHLEYYGIIDDPSFYTCKLSSEEIHNIYENTGGGGYGGECLPHAYVDMNTQYEAYDTVNNIEITNYHVSIRPNRFNTPDKALEFYLQNSSIDISNIDFQGEKFYIETWINYNPNNNTEGYLCDFYDSVNASRMYLKYIPIGNDSAKLRACTTIGDGTQDIYCFDSRTIPRKGWHRVAVLNPVEVNDLLGNGYIAFIIFDTSIVGLDTLPSIYHYNFTDSQRKMAIGNSYTLQDSTFYGKMDNFVMYQCVPDSEYVFDSFFDGGWHDGDCGTLNVTVNTTNPNCGATDGSATVSITGGSGLYEKLWSTGDTTTTITGLEAGNYSIQVTDLVHNCTDINYFTINSNDGPQINIDSTNNISCYGGNDGYISINIGGNVPTNQILWSNGFVGATTLPNLQAGTYQVTVSDNNGCMTSSEIILTQPEPIEISDTVTNPSCGNSDGNIDISVSGGTPNYTYLWNNGSTTEDLTNISSGNYSVTISDNNGCIDSLHIALSDVGSPVLTIDSIKPASCNADNGAIYISASGTDGTEVYAWSNGASTDDINGLAPGNYTLTLTQGNCTAMLNAEVTPVLPGKQEICIVTVDSAIGANLIVWEKAVTNEIDHYNIYRETAVPGDFSIIGVRNYDSLGVYVDSMAFPWIRSYSYRISAVDVCGNESELSDIHKTIHVNINQGYLANTVNLIWDDYIGFDYTTFHAIRYDDGQGWNDVDGSPLPANLHSITADILTTTRMFAITVDKPGNACLATRANGGPYSVSISNMDDYIVNTGIKSQMQTSNFDIKLYPNPANSTVNIKSDIIIKKIEFTNISGQVLLSKTLNNKNYTYDISALDNGVYFVKIYSENDLAIIKLIVNK